jgi:type IV secretory pathway VirJ component
LQGGVYQVCPAKATQKFIAKVPGAQIVMLPTVGHGYSVKKHWVDQFDRAFDDLAIHNASPGSAPLATGVDDLPLTEVMSSGGAYPQWFAVFLSGDGGWVGLDRGVAGELAKRGVPVVGWDSLKYFWSPRTPQSAAQDLERVLRHYSQAWGKSQALLVGYSQGADTLPFMVNRLSAAGREMVGFTTLLALSEPAYFEFHVTHWLGNPEGGLPILPELTNWSSRPYVCLYGAEENDSLCPQLSAGGHSLQMPGGHHFGGGYSQIADQVLQRLPATGAAGEAGR